jgi:hypothetical protein
MIILYIGHEVKSDMGKTCRTLDENKCVQNFDECISGKKWFRFRLSETYTRQAICSRNNVTLRGIRATAVKVEKQ